jgi:pre-mRNA-processing factor 17
MDLIQQYGDSDTDEIEERKPTQKQKNTQSVNLTPNAVATLDHQSKSHLLLPMSNQSSISYNMKVEDLYAPVYGPENPFPKFNMGPNANVSIEGYHMNDFAFNQQLYKKENNNMQSKKGRRRKRDSDENDLARPWKTFDEQIDSNAEIQGFGEEAYIVVNEGEDEEKAEQEQLKRMEEEEERKRMEEQAKRQKKEESKSSVVTTGEEGETVDEGVGGYSEFYLEEERDYQGRTFIAHPSHLKPKNYREIRSFLPKKCIHTFSGHTKAVTAIKFFPTYGHLLLSASMDGTARIWGTEEDKRVCIRSYFGHQKAIRGLSFNSDGTRFATCSYDKTVKLWDTETGKVIGTYSNGSTPFCVEIHPTESLGHQMLVGCQNKMIVQWDVREKKIVQKYDRHLGAVNTITFLENGHRFLSTSDDKSMRLWEYGISVEVKYIADPYMHSMPFVAKHPGGKWLLTQSLDDHIYVYENGKHGFRQYKKKVFTGHKISGYACQCGFSNDGRFVFSGDANGNVWFWDFKTGKHLLTKKCHDQVTIGVDWHPIETSKLATASWDSTIKYWD